MDGKDFSGDDTDQMQVTGEMEKDEYLCEDNEASVEAEETTEDLLTDMKLDDETDYIRDFEPGTNWTYHIEVFPWNADDMTENFIKVMKLSSFCNIVMKKKLILKESDEHEKMDDQLKKRQRKGCLHVYVESWQTAKTLMRSLTWKTMQEKEVVFEITRRQPDGSLSETAYIVADTYLMSKIRFREKSKGEFKDRSSKVSNIPGIISREFLDVVFSRSYAAYDGTTPEINRNKDSKLHQKLQEVENFTGSLDMDCLTKGSCRSFVLAHKSVFICGQKLSITANNTQTMVIPPLTHDMGEKAKGDNKVKEPAAQTTSPVITGRPFRGRGAGQGRGMQHAPANTAASRGGSAGRGFQREATTPAGRARGSTRGPLLSHRPTSAPFPRAGPGMPVPMTGRQKMNEKMRRMMSPGAIGHNTYNVPGASLGASRVAGMGSVGDSFKLEIASLQNQLECSTLALEAKIAILERESSYFNEDVRAYDDQDWGRNNFNYETREPDYTYNMFNTHSQHHTQDYQFGPGSAQGFKHGFGASTASSGRDMPYQQMRGSGPKRDRGRGFQPGKPSFAHSGGRGRY